MFRIGKKLLLPMLLPAIAPEAGHGFRLGWAARGFLGRRTIVICCNGGDKMRPSVLRATAHHKAHTTRCISQTVKPHWFKVGSLASCDQSMVTTSAAR